MSESQRPKNESLETILQKVEKAFFVKFGNALILPRQLGNDVESRKVELKPESLIEAVKARLNLSPIFNSVETLNVLPSKSAHVWEQRRVTRKGSTTLEAVNFAPLLRCTLNLPIKNQDEVAMIEGLIGEKEIDATTNFDVFYDGSIYSICREIDVNKRAHPGAIDVRDVFIEAIQNEPEWKFKEIPPNPLRQDFLLYFVNVDEETRGFLGSTFTWHNDTVLVLPMPPSNDFATVIGRILVPKNANILLDYYTTISGTADVNAIITKIIDLQDLIQSTIKRISGLGYFDLLAHYKESTLLEKLVSEHYTLILEGVNYSGRLTKEIDHSEKLLENSIFEKEKEDLIAELQPSKIDIETFSKCVDYAKEVTGKSYTTKVTILGALLGIFGGIIGSVILHFFGI